MHMYLYIYIHIYRKILIIISMIIGDLLAASLANCRRPNKQSGISTTTTATTKTTIDDVVKLGNSSKSKSNLVCVSN